MCNAGRHAGHQGGYALPVHKDRYTKRMTLVISGMSRYNAEAGPRGASGGSKIVVGGKEALQSPKYDHTYTRRALLVVENLDIPL